MTKKNNGISAIIGVIVMFAITVTISASVFVYVELMRLDGEGGEPLHIEGWVENIETNFTIPFKNKSIDVWQVTLSQNISDNEGDTYQMIFDGPYPPLEGFHLQFLYNQYLYNNTEYLLIYDVKRI
ncbi:MAG: hypothetical protein U9R21_00705 [Candidatus Thermoplasmatota archaeon]|nr:hypothetical protein [Candidatus Thermoplasmatota archaeon]